MVYKSTDDEIKVDEFDKDQLTKIENFIADMAEPSVISEEHFIFYNETLNVFFIKLIEMMDDIKEKGNLLGHIDEHGNLGLKVKVQK